MSNAPSHTIGNGEAIKFAIKYVTFPKTTLQLNDLLKLI